jgi:DNA-binding response OmpR family regulator
MTRVIVVADAAWTRNDVHAALTTPTYELVDHDDPATVAGLVADGDVDAVVADFQVGAMGGMAVARSVRENATVRGDDPVPVVLLLDRSADVFLAGRSGAAGWVLKPFSAHELRDAVDRAIDAAAVQPVE